MDVMNERLGTAITGARLLAAAVSPRPWPRVKYLRPTLTRQGRAWKCPPWMESHWNAGVPIGVEELEYLRSTWLQAHPERRAEFEHGSFQADDQNGLAQTLCPIGSTSQNTLVGAMQRCWTFWSTCVKGIIQHKFTLLNDFNGLSALSRNKRQNEKPAFRRETERFAAVAVRC